MCKVNIPPEKKEQDSDMQVEVEFDTSQFTGLTTQQKLDTELNKLVEQNIDDDDSSSDESMRSRHVEQRRERSRHVEERKDYRMQDDDRPHQYSKGSYARGSNEQPGQIGDKRKFMSIKEPMSPESIRKVARKVIKECPSSFEWHVVSTFPK